MNWLKRSVDYITTGVWEKKDGDFKTRKGFWLGKFIRLMVYTIKGIGRHESFLRSAALTFFTLMSLVPLLALGFGIIKAFGLEEGILTFLMNQFPQYNDAIDSVTDFANGVLSRTRGGVVAVTGLVLLVWASIRVLVNIEAAFNAIWEVKRRRRIGRKISAYMSIIFIAPLLLAAFSILVSYARTLVEKHTFIPSSFFYVAVSLVVIWGVFTIVYKIVPYTKVKWKTAIIAGSTAAIAYMIFQGIYLYIQNSMNAYNIIYGSFAAIPLFLFWLQVNWQIVLLGAELSFSYQNVRNYRQERDAAEISYDSRRKVTLAILAIVARNFYEDRGGMTSEQLAEELSMPLRLVRDILYDLENAGFVLAAKSPESEKINIYMPARDFRSVTFYGALRDVEELGLSVESNSSNRELKRVAKALDVIKRNVEDSELNMSITDLIGGEKGSINTGKRKRS